MAASKLASCKQAIALHVTVTEAGTPYSALIIKLPYGRGSLDIEMPDECHVVEPRMLPGVPDEKVAIDAALSDPIRSEPLRSLVSPGAHVGVVVCDVTRPFPARRVLPVLIEQLEGSEVTVFVATGTHRACTDQELNQMLGPEIISRCRIIQHDAFSAERHREVGRLSGTGTPVLIEEEFLQQDLRITTGFIEPHFFAGFSGGPKMVAPGLAAIETVLDLHSALRIGSPSARWGVTEGNPVHEAVRSIAAMVGVHFNLDVTLNREHAITAVFAGDLFSSHAEGCKFVHQTAMAAVPRQYDVVVTSNSGYPLDQNLYQSVKGMSAAAQIVREGGSIIIASECSDGIPEHGQYKNLLKQASGPAAFMNQLAEPGFSVHDQWQVQVQAQIQKRARVYVKADGLSDRQLREAWFEPVHDIAALVHERGGSSAVIPQGPQTIPYTDNN